MLLWTQVNRKGLKQFSKLRWLEVLSQMRHKSFAWDESDSLHLLHERNA